MKKQILALMVSATIFAMNPAFGMNPTFGMNPLEDHQIPTYKIKLQEKLQKLDEDLRKVQKQIREEVECFNVGWPEGNQTDPRISAIHTQQHHVRNQIELGDRMGQLLQSQMIRPFNGTLLIAENDEIIFEDSRGEKGSPNLHSQFVVGSLSKQITAAVVGAAVQKNLLTFHTPIKAYLPEITDPWTEKVTLHHLLNHTSGFKAIGEPLKFEPGRHFSYSNEAYDLVGNILEKVTGRPCKDLTEELFEGSGMNNSFSPEWEKTDAASSYPCLLEGYVENEQGEIHLTQECRKTASNPSGGLVSTAHDLLKWNLAFHGGKFLQPDIYQQIITPSSQRKHWWGIVGYGYGVHINKTANIQEIFHGGLASGFCSTLIYYPHNKMSLIILENKGLWTDKWELKDLETAFSPHDQIRDVVRKSFVH